MLQQVMNEVSIDKGGYKHEKESDHRTIHIRMRGFHHRNRFGCKLLNNLE
jgi:hypothetical protein